MMTAGTFLRACTALGAGRRVWRGVCEQLRGLWQRPAEQALARRMVGWTLVISSVVALLATGLQLFIDYRRDTSAIHARLDEIERSYLESIAVSAWHMNDVQVRTQLRGILRLPDVAYVALLGADGQPDAEDGSRLQVVQPIERHYPVAFKREGGGKPLPLGTLVVVATLEQVLRGLADKALVILLTQTVKTFVVALSMLLLFQHLVSRPLSALARAARKLNVQQLDAPIALQRARRSDELDVLVDALEGMRGSLQRDVTELHRTKAELAAHRALLEEQVQLRTAELADNVVQLRSTVAQLHEEMQRRQAVEQQLRRQALHDALTGLPNRALLMDRLEHAIRLARRNRHELTLLFIDLDRFKAVNDSLGHEAGDRLLTTVTARVAECVRTSDTFARLGGDEFVLLLPNAVPAEVLQRLLLRITAAVNQPVQLGGHEVAVTCSIGCSVYPHDGEDGVTLLKHADAAMYRAKKQGRNTVRHYSAPLHSKLT